MFWVLVTLDVVFEGLANVTAWLLPCADVVAELLDPLFAPPVV
ncbi:MULTISPECIES: hypothetical protein [Variovorax]|nr:MULTISPECIES: hypothetical protein [Variovorax]